MNEPGKFTMMSAPSMKREEAHYWPGEDNHGPRNVVQNLATRALNLEVAVELAEARADRLADALQGLLDYLDTVDPVDGDPAVVRALAVLDAHDAAGSALDE